MTVSPTFNDPSCTSTVATGPRPRSSFDSSTVPDADRRGFALKSPMSATSKTISSRPSRFWRFLAETGTITVSPPHSSGSRPMSDNACFTRSAFASGLSILLMATMIFTPAALA